MFMIEKLEDTDNNEKENNSAIRIKPLGFPSSIVVFFKNTYKVYISPLHTVNKVSM